METVGAFDAKTHLAKLLDRVEQGESVTITRHGKPVARLVPIAEEARTRSREAMERIRARRKRLKGASISELIETIHEGHRY